MKLSDVVDHFLLDCEVSGRSRITIADYRRRLGVLVQLLQELCQVTDLEQVTIVALRRCVQHLMTEKVVHRYGRRAEGETLAPVTVRAFVRVFKAFFHWCYLEDLMDSDPASRLASPKVPGRVVPAFASEHLEKMLAACDTSTPMGFRDYVILLLLLDTGMRIGELCNLKVTDVHDRFVKVFGKGRREREIGIHPEVSKLLWKYIQKYRRPSDPDEQALFIGRGQPLHIIGVQDIIKRIQHRSGLDGIKFTAHVFRHTFAKEYLNRGGDVFRLSREMGHSDVQVTRIYLEDFNSSDARREHTAFSPVSGIDLKKKSGKRKKRRE